MSDVSTPSELAAGTAERYVAHHLALFGLDRAALYGERSGLRILYRPGSAALEDVRRDLDRGQAVVALQPAADFCTALAIARTEHVIEAPRRFSLASGERRTLLRLRTLHAFDAYRGAGLRVLARTDDGDCVWAAVQRGAGTLFLIGSDLSADLLRYRQGDPAQAGAAVDRSLWGFDFERPNYLFEPQRAGEPAHERHADWLVEALAGLLAEAGIARAPMLPGGAPGAVVVTGDDDQAYLEAYDEQVELLGDIPVSYFLHPQTRHRRRSLRALRRRNPGIEFELHPDALEAPAKYGESLDAEVRWFRRLTGRSPCAVRNHGYLNDGYWGHLPHWLRHGIGASSNIPGFDGRVLNGSLIPAQMIWQGEMVPHWSMLTAIGDGVVFVKEIDDREAAGYIHRLADAVRASGVPGVIVLNLHPQNVARTRALHVAVLELVRSGFKAWNLGGCIEWFRSRSEPAAAASAQPAGLAALLRRLRERMLP